MTFKKIDVSQLAQSASPQVEVYKYRLATSSIEVARVFAKVHGTVVQEIAALRDSLPSDQRGHFCTERADKYWLSREGFMLFTASYRGKKAMAYRVAFIRAFEAAQRTQQPNPKLAPANPEDFTGGLIAIQTAAIGNDAIPTCNARDLHAFLEVETRFNDWITRRIEEYDFEEGKDFCSSNLSSKTEGSGGHNRKDYHLSLDMAKELSMVERTEKGKQARRYFIECEKRAKDTLLGLDDESPLEAPERFHRLRGDDLRQATTHRAMRKLGVETHYQTNCVFYTPREWKNAPLKRWLVTKPKRRYKWEASVLPATIEPLSPDAVIVEPELLRQWLENFPANKTLALGAGEGGKP